MRQPHLQSQHRPRLPPPRLFRQAAILLERVPRPCRSRAAAEVRTRDHLFRMAVHAAGESAAENGGRSRQGALRQVASVARIEQREIRVLPVRLAPDFVSLNPGYTCLIPGRSHIFGDEADIRRLPSEGVGFDALSDVAEDGHGASGDTTQEIFPHCPAAVFGYKPDI
jgi:hypothetical protein